MNTIAVVCMLPFLIAAIDAVPNECITSRDCPRNMTCPGVGGIRHCVNSTCATVTVLETHVDDDGGVGKNFDFSAEEFSKMVGYDYWHTHEFEVVQSGSNSWEGEISVLKLENTGRGWKNEGSAAGDWKVSDTISLKKCSNPDKYPCKDVTFGKCDLARKFLSKKSQQTVQLCHADCYVTDNCTNYRYDNVTQECILMSGEYRGEMCDIIAGPVDKEARHCYAQKNKQRCEFHMEEDCEYDGELLERFPEAISSPNACRDKCKFQKACKYWIYQMSEFLCILKRDGNRTCNVLGGPKQPSYDECKNQSMSRQALGL